MHDRKATYTIVYDAADPDLSDRDHTYGTTLLMADWLAIRNDPAMVGMSEPVLVEQFFANSWERAMQHWNDLRGHGQYWVRCRAESHQGDSTVKWVSDDYQCAVCAVTAKIFKVAGEFSGLPLDKQLSEQIKEAVISKVMRAGGLPTIKNWTVSSTRVPPDSSCLEFWFQTEQDGGASHTVRLHLR